MDYAFFESLTPKETKDFLARFLELESKAAEDMVRKANQGLAADFRLESLSPVLLWVSNKLKKLPRQPDKSVPDWIRQSDSYRANLFDFDEESKKLILRAAYYMGETFVRSFPRLSWATGNPETALKNMPVVRGFRSDLELAPMLVLENVFGRILSGSGTPTDVKNMIAYWAGKAK